MEDDFKPVVQHQRRVNSKIHEVIKKEVIKLLDAGLIYPISDSLSVTGWRVCIDYRKLNDATRKDHFPLPFSDQMLELLAGNEYYCFLDGFSGYFQIPIDPQDQENTTFICPYGMFAYRRMPFGLCNAPGTFSKVHDGHFPRHDRGNNGGAENLAVGHLSRLENPHQGDLEKKEITKTFPLEALRMISFHGDSSTPWFADIANYHAGNFVVKGIFDLKTTGDHRKVQMNELNELRDQSYENSLIYKEKTKKIHDSKIKNRVFNVGDQVSDISKRTKTKLKWTNPSTRLEECEKMKP
ncbi:reverse transcriptase domain-containing protein [Tanacetum coccineum]